MPSKVTIRTQASSGRVALFFASVVIAAALVFAVSSKPANAGHKWIGPAIAGAVIGGVIAHHGHRYYHRHGHRHYRHHARPHYYYKPRKYVRYYRPHHPRRYYGAPHISIRGPGFGLYIGR